MRLGIILTVIAVIAVASIAVAGIFATRPSSQPLEIVPPEPSFGVEERTVDTTTLPTPYDEGSPSLRQLADDAGFLIGAAVEPEDMTWEPSYNATLAREFNALTVENVLKFGLIRKTEDRYVLGPADMIVDFANQNGMAVRGHTLVWHAEVPEWLTAQDLSRDELAAVLEDHIKMLVGRYEGRIQYWDVLNEAIDWDGSMRQTIWLEKLGPNYMDLVFQWARDADPDAKLYYNDYSAEGLGAKSDGVYELVKGMVERGVPIDGVGFQGHFTLENAPSSEDVAANIERIAALGLEVQFTEFDVRLEEPVTDEAVQNQADIYWRMMNTCLEQPACNGFTTWGVTDKFSWITSQLEGYAAGLMFDDAYEPKPAYWAIRDALERRLSTVAGSPKAP